MVGLETRHTHLQEHEIAVLCQLAPEMGAARRMEPKGEQWPVMPAQHTGCSLNYSSLGLISERRSLPSGP